MAAVETSDALSRFSSASRRWFADTFERPTEAQNLGWDAISKGEHTLLLAPTGSGKTLAAFLWCLDQLATNPAPLTPKGKRIGVRVLYVSPLKALSYDIERNLRAPLAGLRLAALRDGNEQLDVEVATRTGDTSQKERDRIRRNPPDILITTPESLYLMLTSRTRDMLKTVDTVIIDEIHTMASTKRGVHLALSLERLELLTEKPAQRIGLSATQRPLEEVARYLGGDRPVTIANAGSKPNLKLKVVVPVEDMARPGESFAEAAVAEGAYGAEARTSIWPALYPRILEQVRAHSSTLVFVNNRRLAERVALRVNELADEDLLRTHHGSMSPEQRTEVEEGLKSGQLPGLACTSSMELGIDMGAIDLVIQIESPKSVSRGLQRIGRAGHQVGETSEGLIFPMFKGDLVECAVLTERMEQGFIEEMRVPRNTLDVLSQQIVAMCAMDEWPVDDLEKVIRRAYSFADLSREALENVLGMLAGQYPADEFADLRPRVIWDRATDIVSSRRDAKSVAVINGGTIPDRGLFGVFLGEGGPRVGELDEEMVYESRVGETFLLGSSTWRIEQITRDQVIVSPAPGEPGKVPFWRGDGLGRPLEFGRAIGAFTRKLDAQTHDEQVATLQQGHHLDALATDNLLDYLQEQKEASGAIPNDRTVVVERFRDELGDWRVVILTPFGGQVHAPWALALEAVLAERSGFDVQTIWSDDGIAMRFSAGDEPPAEDMLFPDPEELREMLLSRLADSSLFASRFRENAARALLLPRPRPGMRTPLWMQRQRSSNLLAVASRYDSFPIILETYRECMQDVFDVPGLTEVLTEIRSRQIRVVSAETREASPFARSLIFDYIAAYMYEGDAPLAEQRAQALTLDRNLLNDLLGEEELRELLDPEALEQTELELQGLAENRRARHPDHLHDLLRRVGDLAEHEIDGRVAEPEQRDSWLAELSSSHRACAVRISGELRWIAAEDAGLYRDALGVSPPLGVPEAFLKPHPGNEALDALTARFARTRAPFLSAEPATRWSVPAAAMDDALRRLEFAGTVVHGDFRPGGMAREWCDTEVLRILRRRSLARLRKEVEPVDHAALARFQLRWQGVTAPASGVQGLRAALQRLEGVPLPVSALETDILPTRVVDYNPAMLDELCATGEIVWVGAGSLRSDDGRIVLLRRDMAAALAPPESADVPDEEIHRAMLEFLKLRGASFFADLVGATGTHPRETLDALWDLVWAGAITNDAFAPLRALGKSRPTRTSPRAGNLIPADAVGRWTLTPAGFGTLAEPTARAHALANALLERYGVVTRETVAAEGVFGGFSAVYPVLKAMEESGNVRRGYFVDGLGGAQFALPGAVDRLRAERLPADEPLVDVLAVVDPANPWGATLPWPERGAERRTPQRTAGAFVVLVDGEPSLYVERGARALVSMPRFDGVRAAADSVEALKDLAEQLPRGTITIERIDGSPVSESPLSELFSDHGFSDGYRGLTYREPKRGSRNARR